MKKNDNQPKYNISQDKFTFLGGCLEDSIFEVNRTVDIYAGNIHGYVRASIVNISVQNNDTVNIGGNINATSLIIDNRGNGIIWLSGNVNVDNIFLLGEGKVYIAGSVCSSTLRVSENSLIDLCLNGNLTSQDISLLGNGKIIIQNDISTTYLTIGNNNVKFYSVSATEMNLVGAGNIEIACSIESTSLIIGSKEVNFSTSADIEVTDLIYQHEGRLTCSGYFDGNVTFLANGVFSILKGEFTGSIDTAKANTGIVKILGNNGEFNGNIGLTHKLAEVSCTGKTVIKGSVNAKTFTISGADVTVKGLLQSDTYFKALEGPVAGSLDALNGFLGNLELSNSCLVKVQNSSFIGNITSILGTTTESILMLIDVSLNGAMDLTEGGCVEVIGRTGGIINSDMILLGNGAVVRARIASVNKVMFIEDGGIIIIDEKVQIEKVFFGKQNNSLILLPNGQFISSDIINDGMPLEYAEKITTPSPSLPSEIPYVSKKIEGKGKNPIKEDSSDYSEEEEFIIDTHTETNNHEKFPQQKQIDQSAPLTQSYTNEVEELIESSVGECLVTSKPSSFVVPVDDNTTLEVKVGISYDQWIDYYYKSEPTETSKGNNVKEMIEQKIASIQVGFPLTSPAYKPIETEQESNYNQWDEAIIEVLGDL